MTIFLGILLFLISVSVSAGNDVKTTGYESYFKPELLNDYGSDHEITLQRLIYDTEGSINFWVYPTWSHNSKKRHMLISLKWNGIGDRSLYFFQEYVKEKKIFRLVFFPVNKKIACFVNTKLLAEKWYMLTVEWKLEDKYECALFINGAQVDEKKRPIESLGRTARKLVVGYDKTSYGWSFSNNKSDFIDIRLYRYKLLKQDVRELFEKSYKKYGLSTPVLLCDDTKYPLGSGLNKFSKRFLFEPTPDWAISRKNTDELVAKVKRGGFNVLVTPVWQGRGARYKTNYVPLEEKVASRINNNDDPLKYMLKKSHDAGIEFHAWFNVVQRRKDFLKQYWEKGTPDNAFDLHNKAFRKFYVGLVEDVVKRYPVDGVNLDHIRSMGVCKTSQCYKNYKDKYDISLTSDLLTWRINSSAFNRISNWNYDALTDIVSNIAEVVKSVNPRIVLSVDAHPLKRGWLLQGQDSIRWVNEGLVDVIFNMDYEFQPNYFQGKEIERKLKKPESLIMLFANYDSSIKKIRILRTPNRLIEYIRTDFLELSGSGYGFYYSKIMSEAQLTALRTETTCFSSTPNWDDVLVMEPTS